MFIFSLSSRKKKKKKRKQVKQFFWLVFDCHPIVCKHTIHQKKKNGFVITWILHQIYMFFIKVNPEAG